MLSATLLNYNDLKPFRDKQFYHDYTFLFVLKIYFPKAKWTQLKFSERENDINIWTMYRFYWIMNTNLWNSLTLSRRLQYRAFTDRIRNMGGGLCFHRHLSVHRGWGGSVRSEGGWWVSGQGGVWSERGLPFFREGLPFYAVANPATGVGGGGKKHEI